MTPPNSFKNVEIDLQDSGLLTIRIDTKKTCGLSKTGKSMVIASTSGNIVISDDGIVLGINCYRRRV